TSRSTRTQPRSSAATTVCVPVNKMSRMLCRSMQEEPMHGRYLEVRLMGHQMEIVLLLTGVQQAPELWLFLKQYLQQVAAHLHQILILSLIILLLQLSAA